MPTPKILEVTYPPLERRFAFTAVVPFLLLFALLYSAFGVASPFLPVLIEARGIPAEQIGIIFGAATAIRLISATIAGRIADRTQALRATLAACTVATALAALGYLSASGFWALLVVSLLHALALAPTINLADALAVVAAEREGIDYGWARGAGSAAFIVGSIAAGFTASAFGIWIVVVLQAMMMLAVPLASRLVPPVTDSRPTTDRILQGGLGALLRLAVFRRVVRIADRTQALRATLAACTVATALAALGYLSASGFWPGSRPGATQDNLFKVGHLSHNLSP
jgi:MFS transporter, PPP family, 3-phenylpropionic acid transporter